MTFTSVHTLADFINRNHFNFAGHRIAVGCANVRTFDTIMRAVDFLKAEKAATSADFDAGFMQMGKAIQTTITIGISDFGISYAEHIKR